MGVKLVGYYETASKEYGALGRMKLALLTQISSTKAANEADSIDNVKKFEDAIAQLRKAAA
ncbi:MAG: hypothetical protein ACHQQ3_12495 [Gemmatimonadales bacterium]